MVGNKIGVVGITDTPPRGMKRVLGTSFHSYSYSPNLRHTTDLFTKRAKNELYHIIQTVIKNGADVILFACTGFSTIKLKDFLVKRIDQPVIDLVESQAVAYQLSAGL